MPSPRFVYMLKAPLLPMLLRLSTPNVAIVLAQTGSVIADAWFVGRIGGPAATTALASLAVVYPMQAMMQMMSAGAMGGGISSAVARALGNGQAQRAANIAVHALIIGLVMAGVYALLAGVFARELFALLGAKGAALDGAVRYAHIMFLLTGGIGLTVGLAPGLWLSHFSADPQVLGVGHEYLRIVAPLYGFIGLGMALYFATQGTGNMLWPLAAGALRLLVAAGGSAVASVWLGLGVSAIFVCVAASLLVFGLTVAASLQAPHWKVHADAASRMP